MGSDIPEKYKHLVREPGRRTCNRHDDCDAADARVRQDPNNRDYYGRLIRYKADHCHDECCEECFGY